MQKALSFKPLQKDEFSKTLRDRVKAYFDESGKKQTANTEMHMKMIFFVSLWAGSWALGVFGGLDLPFHYLTFAILGMAIPLVAVNVGHDAIHGAYSKKKWVNQLLSHTFNFNGASAYMWKKMHNVAHHTYTNVHDYDEDIESVPILRLSPKTPIMKIHKFQHIYAFLLYGLGTISWALIKDYKKFFKNEVGNYNDDKHPAKEYFYLFFYKAINYTLFMALPFIFIELPWYHILGGLGLMHFIAGFYLAVVFMLAHIVEHVHYPNPNVETGSIENSFMIHQLYTTCDFGRRSRLVGYMTGGLNTQVVHHLFPLMCSVHYPKISDIVKQTADDCGLDYFEYPTFGKAIASHVRLLKLLGRIDNYKPEQWKQAA